VCAREESANKGSVGIFLSLSLSLSGDKIHTASGLTFVQDEPGQPGYTSVLPGSLNFSVAYRAQTPPRYPRNLTNL